MNTKNGAHKLYHFKISCYNMSPRNKSNKIQDEADQIKLSVRCNVTETSKTKIHEHTWPNTTKGTSCLLFRKLRFLLYLTGDLKSFPWYKICKNGSDHFENTSFTKCEFPFILFIFYTLFGSLSQNKHGGQDVPFVVLGHIFVFNY